MTFQTPYLFGFVLLILGVAAVVTFFAYRKSNFTGIYRFLLPGLRWFSLVILGLLLLNPSIRNTSFTEERPLLIWLQDESESILQNADSLAFTEEYYAWQKEAVEQLSTKFDVVELGFDASVHSPKHTFNGSRSAVQEALSDATYRLEGRNAAGVVLASDGIVNSGMTLNATARISYPIHSLVLGDSTSYSDVEISRVIANSVAFTGNATPIRAEISAHGTVVNSVLVTLLEEGRVLKSQRLPLNGNQGVATFDVQSDSAGVRRFQVAVEMEQSERNKFNNRKSVRVEFLDKKHSIYFVYGAPNPDVSALRFPLLNDEANDLQLVAAKDWNGEEARKSDIVVFLHVEPLPEMIEVLQEGKVNTLLVTKDDRDYNDWQFEWQDIQASIELSGNSEALPRVNESFGLFQLNPKFLEKWSSFPPINAGIHGEEKLSYWTPVLLANVGRVNTNTPLVSVRNQGDQRIAWVNGEGWWRTRAYSFAEYRTHQPYDEFWNGLYEWLLSNSAEDRLQVIYPERILQNEVIPFTVKPSDESGKFIGGAEVTLSIVNGSQTVFEQRLSEVNSGNYQSTVDGLSAGKYRFKVTSTFGDEVLTESGAFYVESVVLEQLDTRARAMELRAISNRSKGEFAMYTDREEWLSSLVSRDAQVILHEKETNESLLEKWWPYVLLLLFLTAEWALRKREGQV